MFEELIKVTGLPGEIVEASLEKAIAESLCTCLGMYDCDVDIENKTAVGVFRIPEDISLEACRFLSPTVVGQDLVTVKFDFASFPRRVVRRCSKVFLRVLLDIRASAKYREWQSKTRSATEGVIINTTRDCVELDLGDQVGVLHRPEWVLAEAKQRYRWRKPMSVYVLRVEKRGPFVTVFVSRQARNLPASLLRQRVPWSKFVCVYRKPGTRSVVITNCPLGDGSLKTANKEVQIELGERIKIKHDKAAQ